MEHPDRRHRDQHSVRVVHLEGLGQGRVLQATDSGDDGPAVLWHAGSPHTGSLLGPVLDAARACGMRVITYARPGYGASTRSPGRIVADAARDSAAVADAFGVGRFAVVGYSGGGPHALACAALLPDRVGAAVTVAGLAPRTEDPGWFAGMADPAALRSALEGVAAREAHAEHAEFDPDSFTPSDWSALEQEWGALGTDAQAADRHGTAGLVDDDVAFVRGWGFGPEDVRAPVLLLHGDADRVVPFAHAERLSQLVAPAELSPQRGSGHVSVLRSLPEAFAWLSATG